MTFDYDKHRGDNDMAEEGAESEQIEMQTDVPEQFPVKSEIHADVDADCEQMQVEEAQTAEEQAAQERQAQEAQERPNAYLSQLFVPERLPFTEPEGSMDESTSPELRFNEVYNGGSHHQDAAWRNHQRREQNDRISRATRSYSSAALDTASRESSEYYTAPSRLSSSEEEVEG